ncbi:MAG: hypothetical protein HW403_1247 [Dehalococcoidia bacterium]|nr:hypothetical protein [Dehalococcoidia bacterium]
MKQYRYDPKYDVLYIHLRRGKIARTDMLGPDELRQVDYDEAGRPLGVELFAVKRGIKLTGLPQPESIREVVEHLGLEAAIGHE